MRKTILFLLLTMTLVSCSQGTASTPIVPTAAPIQSVEPSSQEVTMPMNLASQSFTAGLPIPVDFTCKGRDVSPALTWTDPPAGTQSFALIMEDPDAPMGTWIHWVIYNIPASARGLPEAVPADANLPDGSIQGTTSANSAGYHGPCPPSGTHRYFFRLYALDTLLNLPTADKKQLTQAMENHILGQADLMGTFSK